MLFKTNLTDSISFVKELSEKATEIIADSVSLVAFI